MSNKLGNLEVFVQKTKEGAAKKLAEDLSSYLVVAKNSNQNILLLLSAGSAFSVLDFISNNSFGSNLTIAVLDERYDKTNENNNFNQLTKTDFYSRAKAHGCSFIDTSVKQNQTKESLAGFFEGELVSWSKNNPSGEITATVGMGNDGHTSGIMPFPDEKEYFEKLFESDKWVVAYNASGKNEFADRVTTTITFLRKIKRVFCFTVGKNKADVYLRLQKEAPVDEMPVQVIKELHGFVYIDESVLKV